MKKIFGAVLVMTVFAILAGCGRSIQVTDLGFAKVLQFKDKDAIGPNHTGVAIFATPQQQVVAAPPSIVATQCDAKSIYSRLERNRTEIAKCKTFSLNNLRLRLERGNLFLDLFACKCDHESVPEAIKNFEIAARNYKFGKDIKSHKAEADNLMTRVHESWIKAKQLNVAACGSVVTVPQSVVVVPQSQPQLVYSSTGYGPGILESILPAALIAGGGVGAASVLRPSETNVNTNASGGTGTGGAGGSGMGIGTGAAAAASTSTSTSTSSGSGGSSGATGSSGSSAAGN